MNRRAIRDRAGSALTLAALLLAGGAGSCGRAPDPDPGMTSPADVRIVVMAPAAAEMLEALGLLDRVVARGVYGPWPEALAELPPAGDYNSPNLERVLQLRANWVVTTESEAAVAAHRRLEALGVRVLALDTSTYDGILAACRRLGETFGRARRADRIVEHLEQRLDALEARSRSLPKRRVLFVVGRDPLFVAGPGSHLDHLMRLAGGENVAADARSPYQQMSMETVLERLPEVIIDASDNRPGAPRGREPGPWGRWPFLPAVEHDRVWLVEPGKLVIPGLHLPEMGELLGRLIHPEVFGEPGAADLGPENAR